MDENEMTEFIAEKLKEIRDKYYEEYPDGDYLNLVINKDLIRFNNSYWDKDEEYPLEWVE